MDGTDRLHALDAVRAFALLAGIVLHATMSFFLPVPAQDASQSATLAGTFFVIHIFRMATFYFIAGFFAHMVFHRRGGPVFVKDRAKRIAVPLVAGWVILAPLTIGAALWGAMRTFGPEVMEQAPGPAAGGFPWVHLWFLYYLLIFYIAVLAIRWVFDAGFDRQGRIRTGIDAVVSRIVRSYFAPLLLAAPIGAWLYFQPDWSLWGGIPTPDTGVMPQMAALIGFGTAFGFGWIVHRQIDLLREWQKRWPVHLAIAAALTAYAMSVVGIMPDFAALMDPSQRMGLGIERLAYTAAYTLAIWYWTFGIVGAALTFCSNVSPVRRYLADSSYWLYLWHLPIIFFLQVVVAPWPVHWSLKFIGILAVTVTVLLFSYHYLVRSTFVGATINGRRRPRTMTAAATAAAE